MRKIAFAAALLCAPAAVSAATISGYNVTSAIASGDGNWFHSYDATITPAGTGAADTHLLSSADNVTIELFFDAMYVLTGIDLFSFNDGNSIPGSLTGFDISWGGGSAGFTTTQDGNNTESASLLGSALEGVAVSSVTLSNFTTNGQFYDFYALSEISFDSTLASEVPLPASGLLLFGGLAALGLRKRKPS